VWEEETWEHVVEVREEGRDEKMRIVELLSEGGKRGRMDEKVTEKERETGRRWGRSKKRERGG